ncbi:hypothetical protein CK203_049886 [Vitis vinifera]|uniref:Uncharacterized protein n=1 Tax=Vitis vinifera TaxID=29760 RepID=A0A438GVU9_VITVI|nr:hypothetical protein CK203_049886 [Vitis vinifera]
MTTLGQELGVKQLNSEKGSLRRENSSAMGNGKSVSKVSSSQLRGSTTNFGSKKLWTSLFPPISGCRQWCKGSARVLSLLVDHQGSEEVVLGKRLCRQEGINSLKTLPSIPIEAPNLVADWPVEAEFSSLGRKQKGEVCDRRFISSVWLVRNKEWASLPACGASREIFIIWDSKKLCNEEVNIPFTWSNMQDSPVYKRLDQFLYTNEWEKFFPQSLQEVLPRWTSDHWSIVLDTNPFKWGPTPFRVLSSELSAQRALRKEELEELILRKEVHWRQKVRVKRVKEGDRNSKFFHKVANGGRNRKFIKFLENERGLVLNNIDSITEEILLFYEKLYLSPPRESWRVEGLDWSPILEKSAFRLNSPVY